MNHLKNDTSNLCCFDLGIVPGLYRSDGVTGLTWRAGSDPSRSSTRAKGPVMETALTCGRLAPVSYFALVAWYSAQISDESNAIGNHKLSYHSVFPWNHKLSYLYICPLYCDALVFVESSCWRQARNWVPYINYNGISELIDLVKMYTYSIDGA